MRQFHQAIKAISAAAFLVLAGGCGESPKPAEPPMVQFNEDQGDFIRIVTTAQAEAAKVENDMQLGGVKAKRDAAMCNEFKAKGNSLPIAADWVGKVALVDSNSDGKGVFSVTLAPKVTVSTWNNALSDIATNTLMEPGSPTFVAASTMKPGQQVIFSGRFFRTEGDCLSESSLTLRGKVREPQFVFKFTDIAPYTSAEAAAAAARAAPVPSASPAHPVAAAPAVVPAQPEPAPAAPAIEAQVPAPAVVATAAAPVSEQPAVPTVAEASKPEQGGPAQPQPVVAAVVAPSFNCAKASTLIEELICKDENLAKLDVKLAGVYGEAVKNTDDKASLKAAQLDWMKSRRNKCENAKCLSDAYEERISQLVP